jgi:hypothetical protein
LGAGLEILLRRKLTQKMMTPKQINDKLRLWEYLTTKEDA